MKTPQISLLKMAIETVAQSCYILEKQENRSMKDDTWKVKSNDIKIMSFSVEYKFLKCWYSMWAVALKIVRLKWKMSTYENIFALPTILNVLYHSIQRFTAGFVLSFHSIS